MADPVPQEQDQIVPVRARGITIIEHRAEVHVYRLTEPQLERLSETGTGRTVNFAFAGALFGGLVTLIAVLMTIDIDSSRETAGVVSGLITLAILFVFFSVQAGLDYRRGNQEMRHIREQD